MNAAPSPPVTHLFARDGDGSGNGLSTGSIIAIVVVCACVGILVLALFLWRLLIRFCRPNHPAPLPPVQELAHRREQQLAALAEQRMENRPTTWLDDSFNSRGSQMLYQASSAQSLLPQGTPERKSSIQTDGDEGATAESMSPLPSPVPMEPPLHPPNPAFFGSSGWDSSNSSPNNSPRDSFIGASGNPGIEPAPSPSPSVPFSSSSSSGSHITAAGSQPFQSSSSHATYPRQMRSRSNYRTDAQGRRLSLVSSVGTNFSSPGFRSTSVIRGAPHSRHSTVQIVLPAPLGPHSPMEGYGNQEARRSSVMADQWVMAGSREGSVDSGSRERSRSRHGKFDKCLVLIPQLTSAIQATVVLRHSLPLATSLTSHLPRKRYRWCRRGHRAPSPNRAHHTPVPMRIYPLPSHASQKPTALLTSIRLLSSQSGDGLHFLNPWLQHYLYKRIMQVPNANSRLLPHHHRHRRDLTGSCTNSGILFNDHTLPRSASGPVYIACCRLQDI